MKTLLKAAPFKVDITPPVGHPITYGINRKVDTPIYLRGIGLNDGKGRFVLAVADVIGISGRSHQALTRLIAKTAGCRPSNVLLHAVHQHDSVCIGRDTDRLVSNAGFQPNVTDEYWSQLTHVVSRHIDAALRPRKWKTVRRVETAERRVRNLAANRRLLGPDNKVTAMRFSMCGDPHLRKEPVGTIDPFLRTVCFTGPKGRKIAALHFYATHPQVAYHRNKIGGDVPGYALGVVEKHTEDPNTIHLYFSGCGANVTFGKHTDGSKKENLTKLSRRLGREILNNMTCLEPKKTGPVCCKRSRFDLPIQKGISERKLTDELQNAETEAAAFYAARKLLALQRLKRRMKPMIQRMDIGPDVSLLSFPSETVVEYQLYAQSLIPDRFLACAAYRDYSWFYLPTAAMYKQGGYEPSRGMYTPKLEKNIRGCIDTLLADLR